jgi:hypothetical protein
MAAPEEKMVITLPPQSTEYPNRRVSWPRIRNWILNDRQKSSTSSGKKML